MIAVSKTFEWDMGHRVTNHDSLCKNPHGHRYKMIVHVSGPVVKESGSAKEGMVIDFGALKQIVKKTVVDDLDHSFMYWDKDEIMKTFAEQQKEFKMRAVPFVPTAECIAQDLAQKLQSIFSIEMPDLTLTSLQIFETPNSCATWSNEA